MGDGAASLDVRPLARQRISLARQFFERLVQVRQPPAE
jgi:hypothetical protein